MNNIAVSSSSSALHTILEKFAAEVENVCSEMRARTCDELAARLNQAVRRIRQAATREELGETLADTAAAFAAGAVWLRIEDSVARSEKLELTIPLAEAAALTGAVETREPVIALTSSAEVSPQLVERFTHTAESRSFVYPILVGEKAPALLYAWADKQHAAQTSALELLAQVASAAWQALEPPPPASAVGEYCSRGQTRQPVGSPRRRGTADPPARPALRPRAGGGDAVAKRRRGAIGTLASQFIPLTARFRRRCAQRIS